MCRVVGQSPLGSSLSVALYSIASLVTVCCFHGNRSGYWSALAVGGLAVRLTRLTARFARLHGRPAGASDRFSINVLLFIDRSSPPPATAEMQNRSELIDFSVLPKSLYWLVRRRQRRPGSICRQRACRDADDDDDDDDNLLAGGEVVTCYQAWLDWEHQRISVVKSKGGEFILVKFAVSFYLDLLKVFLSIRALRVV